MAIGDALHMRLNILHKNGANVRKAMRDAMRDATFTAVDAAAQATPPNEKTNRGTKTVTGELKGAWASDSITEPIETSEGFKTALRNNTFYASYVNNGHRMDRHFVPGLILNIHTELLEKVPRDMGGIIVGTQTQYVPGVYMTDTARKAYEEALIEGLSNKCRAALRGGDNQ